MERCCVSCDWFKDGRFNKTYVSPRCTVRGDDDCAYMRQNVCGVDEARLFQPITEQPKAVPIETN